MFQPRLRLLKEKGRSSKKRSLKLSQVQTEGRERELTKKQRRSPQADEGKNKGTGRGKGKKTTWTWATNCQRLCNREISGQGKNNETGPRRLQRFYEGRIHSPRGKGRHTVGAHPSDMVLPTEGAESAWRVSRPATLVRRGKNWATVRGSSKVSGKKRKRPRKGGRVLS